MLEKFYLYLKGNELGLIYTYECRYSPHMVSSLRQASCRLILFTSSEKNIHLQGIRHSIDNGIMEAWELGFSSDSQLSQG